MKPRRRTVALDILTRRQICPLACFLHLGCQLVAWLMTVWRLAVCPLKQTCLQLGLLRIGRNGDGWEKHVVTDLQAWMGPSLGLTRWCPGTSLYQFGSVWLLCTQVVTYWCKNNAGGFLCYPRVLKKSLVKSSLLCIFIPPVPDDLLAWLVNSATWDYSLALLWCSKLFFFLARPILCQNAVWGSPNPPSTNFIVAGCFCQLLLFFIWFFESKLINE